METILIQSCHVKPVASIPATFEVGFMCRIIAMRTHTLRMRNRSLCIRCWLNGTFSVSLLLFFTWAKKRFFDRVPQFPPNSAETMVESRPIKALTADCSANQIINV